MSTDPAVPPEAYEAAAEALFHANELWPGFSKSELAQSLGGPREARIRTAQAAVDAVWSLGVAEGRRQAAEAIDKAIEQLDPLHSFVDGAEWAARIAEGNTDA